METKTIDFSKYSKVLNTPLFLKMGKVVNVVGLTIESAGPDARLGDVCEIFPEDENAKPIKEFILEQSEVARRKRRTMNVQDISADDLEDIENM